MISQHTYLYQLVVSDYYIHVYE